MSIFIDGKLISEHELTHDVSGNVLCFLKNDKKTEVLEKLYRGKKDSPIHVSNHENQAYFESHVDFDIMSMSVPDYSNLMEEPRKIEIYFSKDRLLFFYDNVPVMDEFIEELKETPEYMESLESVLHHFFLTITEADIYRLEEIEDEIEILEETLAEGNESKDDIQTIRDIRKKLLILKRYYESFSYLLDGVEENQNKVISDTMMRNFHFFASRVDRLYHTVLNLRDYITQVRESYQAQVDIRQNGIMQYFTIITSIFLPLTVIAGWYGMNLKMPEYELPFLYPIVIAVSAIFIVVSVIIFRKRKWL